VLFEPTLLQLLNTRSEQRRDYLDSVIEQTAVGFGTLTRQYKRVLAQRNSLLKQVGKLQKKQLFTWDIRLTEFAGKIVRRRAALVEKINKEIPQTYQSITGSKTPIRLSYDALWPIEGYESNMIKALETNLESDMRRGFTGYGPHREDISTYLNGHLIQNVASRGEMRSTILALKIIELMIIENERAIKPIILFDDVYSELDGKRRHKLSDFIANYQTFITTTDAELLQKQFTENYNTIPLKN